MLSEEAFLVKKVIQPWSCMQKQYTWGYANAGAIHHFRTNLFVDNTCQSRLLLATGLSRTGRHHDCFVPLQQPADATERTYFSQLVAQALIVLINTQRPSQQSQGIVTSPIRRSTLPTNGYLGNGYRRGGCFTARHHAASSYAWSCTIAMRPGRPIAPQNLWR